jgi:diguanylate cyclase (GGDEF)-like protein/PAS domain S-box-containing protein
MAEQPDSQAEIARLNRIIVSLMDRAERNSSGQGSDFSIFQTEIILKEQVHRRTAELDEAARENEKITRALRESEMKFRSLVSQSMVGIALIDDGKFSYSNHKFDEIFGYTADEVRNLGPLDMTAESDLQLVAENTRQRTSGERDEVQYTFHALRKDGVLLDVECHSSALRVGGRLSLLSLILDITDRVRVENEVRSLQEKLRDQSTHDALTGLYNRRFLEESFGRELLLAEHAAMPVSVIMADLDHFKSLNDQFGHLAGDEALRVVGVVLKRFARPNDVICRYGGEEFFMVFPGLGREKALERGEELRIALAATPVTYDSAEIKVTASFGIATFPHDGLTADQLIRAADAALYESKSCGRDRVTASVGAARGR